VKEYIRYIADRRLVQLGLHPLYHLARNPLPWLDEMLNAVEHTNFFENRATEYSRASTTGTWEEAFDDPLVSAEAGPGAAAFRDRVNAQIILSTGKFWPERTEITLQ
jgi:ribonucleoside-diphosphate reductase beta chain